MNTQIRFIFKALSKDYIVNVKEYPNVQQLLAVVAAEKRKIEAQNHLNDLKVFLKKQLPHQVQPQYIKLRNKEFLELQLERFNNPIIVEFFFGSSKMSISTQLNKIGNQLEDRERELKLMVNELKDEASQFYAMEIISKVSSKSYPSQIEHIIDVYLVVSDPLANQNTTNTTSELVPVHNDEVNLASHIERLKRASMSDSNLTIRATRCWGSITKLASILNQEETPEKKINIVQFMTQVRRINGKLMISLQSSCLGLQEWYPAEEILYYNKVDLLIIIGVGAYLLQEIDYSKPLILITSISLQQKRIITQHRSILDSQNSYNDTFSQVFLESFYQNLFKGQEIGQSVKLAKQQSNKYVDKYIWCCCLHEHAPNCGWQQIIDKIGYMQAHRLFKHTFEEWRKDNNYQFTNDIQSFLLKNQQTCSSGTICCYERQGKKKLAFHQQINNILFWNKKCSEVLYSKFDQHQKRLNNFESEQYDKPSGRKRPLTIFKLLQAIVKNQDKVLIIRSPTLSLAKRYLSFAKEYLQAREKQTYFCELTISKEIQIKNYLRDVLKALKSKYKLGTNAVPKINFFLELSYSSQKSDKYYQKFFRDYPSDLLSLAKVIGLQIDRIKIILLTCNPNINDLYPLFKIDDPQPNQLYHYTFSKYSYDYIKANLRSIKAEITKQYKVEDGEIEAICEDMLFERTNVYYYLGFISLFSQDGFYLTKYGRVILDHLFGKEVIDSSIDHALPIEIINLSDCIYLQLHKSYQKHFKSNENAYKAQFQKKQLEYYYILFRTYCQLMYKQTDYVNFQGMLRLIMRKQGLFSINIQSEDKTYDELVEKCKASLILLNGDTKKLFSCNNFRHVYHLNQTQKIIQNFMKKKKNLYVATSKSIIRQVQPFILTYLFWNIIHKAWKIILTLSNQFIDKIAHFQSVLLIFLIRVEITIPFAQIARLQLYLMIEKIPPKSQEIIKCSKEMGRILSFLRTYSMQEYNLSQSQLSWGQTVKFKELICNCSNIAEKLIDLLEKKEGTELSDELQDHKMFKNFTILELNRQILKLTERKIIYYFQLSKMLKNQQTKTSRNQREKQFHNQFKLIDLVNQFRTLRNKLPEKERQEKHRILIDHYLKILLNEAQVDSAIIQDIKGKLSAEYLPLFEHLCQKIQQKTLFNQKGLIICARARTIMSQGKPCIFSRKRNLTMMYLKQTLLKLALKISYFTLNSNTLNNLKSDQNKKCSMLFLILAIDSPNQKQISFGEDSGINSELMDIQKFANQIKGCKINILIIFGKNSKKICAELVEHTKQWEHFPNIIALQNNKYNLCDEPYNDYLSQNPEKSWQYLCNEVNQIAFDMLAITIIANINNKLTHRAWTFSEADLDERVSKSLKMVQNILSHHFECTTEIMNQISFQIWTNNKTIDKIPPGTFEDLTAKFYSSEHNLHDENYYENIGRGYEVNQIIEAFVKEGQRCVQIIGSSNTGKSVLLQQVCWISQTKNIFKFGVFKFNLGEDKDSAMFTFEEFFKNRQLKSSENFKTNKTSVLVALDNIDEQFLSAQKHILKSLKGKSITIMFTTKKKEVGEALQSILECKNSLSVNLNTISLNQVYGFLMSHLKVYNSNENHRYSKQIVKEFEKKVANFMHIIEKEEDGFMLYRALQLLKDISPKKQQDKINMFLNFYKRNFDDLSKLLQNVKQIKVRII